MQVGRIDPPPAAVSHSWCEPRRYSAEEGLGIAPSVVIERHAARGFARGKCVQHRWCSMKI